MPRVRIEVPVSIPAIVTPDDEHGESLDETIGSSKPKRKSTGASPSKIDRAFREFDEMFKSNEWKANPQKIRPNHAVAFYARLHTKVYSTKNQEVFPEELRDGKTWLGACSAVKRLIDGKDRQFDNGAKLFEFILWTWRKEMDRVKWLRDNDKPISKRITWYDQFVSRYKLTDYKQAMAEESERGKRR